MNVAFKITHFDNKLFTSDCESANAGIVMSTLFRLKAFGEINWFYHERKQTICDKRQMQLHSAPKGKNTTQNLQHWNTYLRDPRSIFDKQQRSNSAAEENEPTGLLHASQSTVKQSPSQTLLIARESVLTLTRIVDIKQGGCKTEQQSYFVHTFSGLLNCFKSLT